MDAARTYDNCGQLAGAVNVMRGWISLYGFTLPIEGTELSLNLSSEVQ